MKSKPTVVYAFKNDQIVLVEENNHRFFQACLDGDAFTVGKDLPSRKNIGVNHDPLARAIGWKTGKHLRVLDGTCGLARDLIHLWTLGCDVTGIESNPWVFKVASSIVEQHFKSNQQTYQMNDHGFDSDRLRLYNADLFQFIKTNKNFDVIFLDPMFPDKKSSAKVGKESQVLQKICAQWSMDFEVELMKEILSAGMSRLVVKRPKGAAFIANRTPHHSKEVSAVRYDVYL